jgi:hypothetical protein
MAARRPGYHPNMTIHPEPPDEQERPVEVDGAPAEEDISEADVAERADKDPDDYDNQEELS